MSLALLLRPRLTAAERHEFYARLEDLIRAGRPPDMAVDRITGASGARRLNEFRRVLVASHSLAEAMEAQPDQFSLMERALVRVGEEGGVLDEELGHLRRFWGQRARLVRLIWQALVSPLAALLLALLATSVPTYFLAGPLAYLQATLGPIAVVVIGGLALMQGQVRFPEAWWVRLWRRAVQSMPIVGSLWRTLALASWAQAAADLWSAGVVGADALELAATTIWPGQLRSDLERAAAAVRRGESLTSALDRVRDLPPAWLDTLALAEETGAIDDALARLARSAGERAVAQLESSLPMAARLLLIPLVVLLVFYKIATVVPLLLHRGMEEVGESLLVRLNRILARLLAR